MNPFSAFLLGVVQGLTEFLPVSSTAHLTLAGKLLNVIDPNHPEAWTEFIAVMQLGTVAAVIVYFRRDLWGMTVALYNDLRRPRAAEGRWTERSRLAFFILIGTLPVALVGLSLKRIIEGSLTKSTLVIAISMIVLALLLWLAEKVARHVREISQITWVDSLVIGFAQVCALIPGSSRSGTTITAGLFLGLTRESAARFSFLLSIPAVVASGLYELTKIHGAFDLGAGNLVISTLVSGFVGYASIAWLLKFLMRNTAMVFVWYRILLGVLLITLLLNGFMLP
ncbi:MAG TPA: undecaprenyl-diphosphatase UppP [Bacteroidota bacterium]|nr:undecaprenyl-diphosphatase UppP [Bacteroidota bacterium]